MDTVIITAVSATKSGGGGGFDMLSLPRRGRKFELGYALLGV